MTIITFIFVNSYGNNFDNYAYGITITSSNEIIIVGKDGSGMITKMDLNGNIKWTKKIGGTITLGDVIESSDGKYIIVGQDQQNLITYVSKIDTNGSKIWERSIANYNAPSYGYKIEKMKDGNYLIVDYFGGLIIVDESGNLIKTRRELSYTNTIFYDALGRFEGGYLIVGNISNYGMAIVYNDFSIDYFTKSDNPNTSIYPYFIFQDNDSSYLIGGSISSKGFIIRLDRNISPFQVKWAKIYNEINDIKFISKTSDGNYMAIGNYKPTNDSTQILIFKMDTLGNVILSKIFKSFHNKFITSAIHKNGYVYVISNFKNVNNVDFLLIGTNENFSDICNLQNHNLTSVGFQLNRQSLSHSYSISNSILVPSTSITDLNYNNNNFCAVNSLEFCDDELRILVDGYNLKVISKRKDNFYKIYDISGNSIMKGYLKEGLTNINLNRKGVYILKLKNESHKFIIK